MRAAVRLSVALTATIVAFTGTGSRDAHGQEPGPAHGRVVGRVSGTARPRAKTPPAQIAVQPFEGPHAEPLRGLVVRIVRDRGFRPMTSLPRYEGTGQYPSLAKDYQLAAFVTADMEDRGRWQSITFLVWNGVKGTIVGRWTASAPTTVLARAVGRGFWSHLGPAIRKAASPRQSPGLAPAPPMRIDASNPADNDVRRIAAR